MKELETPNASSATLKMNLWDSERNSRRQTVRILHDEKYRSGYMKEHETTHRPPVAVSGMARECTAKRLVDTLSVPRLLVIAFPEVFRHSSILETCTYSLQ